MQTLVPIGTFEEKARKLLGKAGFDDLLDFLARRPKAGRIAKGPLRAARSREEWRCPRYLLLPQ
jgi:hypothetical protein